jgi:glutathione peroxidase
MNRRSLLVFAAAAALPAVKLHRAAEAAALSQMTAYGFSFAALKGPDIRLADYSGRPIMIVNTASLCGYTPQYAGLQKLWSEYKGAGLMVIGVPSNDFGGQEPGSSAQIDDTAHHQYGVTFPMAAKTSVRGAQAHPFYRWAASERPADLPGWNFHKYLLGRDGRIAAAFPSAVEPTDTKVKIALGKALSAA